MHLDYSIHPINSMERRVNLIVYLNSDWQEEWGGDLQLWEGDEHRPTPLMLLVTVAAAPLLIPWCC